MRKSNLTYEQLIELAPKDRPFQIEVESNPYGEGDKQVLWANIEYDNYYGNYLSTNLLKQNNINGVNYAWLQDWESDYKDKFTLIDEYRNMYEKPELLNRVEKLQNEFQDLREELLNKLK